ncbi:MAG TPA: hypothetical protein VHT53_00190 [Candidatus Elarobacter sp.]|jgi:hypothetical protein|nr:hypothetical protein [Candidatus Elarobacter sp.]
MQKRTLAGPALLIAVTLFSVGATPAPQASVPDDGAGLECQIGASNDLVLLTHGGGLAVRFQKSLSPMHNPPQIVAGGCAAYAHGMTASEPEFLCAPDAAFGLFEFTRGRLVPRQATGNQMMQDVVTAVLGEPRYFRFRVHTGQMGPYACYMIDKIVSSRAGIV